MASCPTGFPGPPTGSNSSPGLSPGIAGPRPPSTGPSTPQQPSNPAPPPPPPAVPGPPPQLASPTKETNMASVCRYGQELVHDIVNKTNEIFQMLKATQLPSGVSNSHAAFQERKTKLDEQVKHLNLAMKKLHKVYDIVQEATFKLETRSVEELLPIEENGEVKGEKPKITDATSYATEEHREMVEQVQSKNHQLKEMIDQFRTIIWEINTMMAMKKS